MVQSLENCKQYSENRCYLLTWCRKKLSRVENCGGMDLGEVCEGAWKSWKNPWFYFPQTAATTVSYHLTINDSVYCFCKCSCRPVPFLCVSINFLSDTCLSVKYLLYQLSHSKAGFMFNGERMQYAQSGVSALFWRKMPSLIYVVWWRELAVKLVIPQEIVVTWNWDMCLWAWKACGLWIKKKVVLHKLQFSSLFL